MKYDSVKKLQHIMLWTGRGVKLVKWWGFHSELMVIDKEGDVTGLRLNHTSMDIMPTVKNYELGGLNVLR